MIKDIEFFIKNIIFSEKFLLEKRLKRGLRKNYEKELRVIDKFKDQERNAVDIGVYRGIYSYKLSKLFKHVHSFEPNPLIYPYLKKNLTKIIKNMTIVNLAVSDSNGEIELKIPNRNKSLFKNNYEELYKLGCATVHKSNKIYQYNKFLVKKVKLDDILINESISFIKIDVEGHEREVINGSLNIIKKNKPIIMVEIEERHSGNPTDETIKLINNLGYESYFVKNNNLEKTINLKNFNIENNYFFVPIKEN